MIPLQIYWEVAGSALDEAVESLAAGSLTENVSGQRCSLSSFEAFRTKRGTAFFLMAFLQKLARGLDSKLEKVTQVFRDNYTHVVLDRFSITFGNLLVLPGDVDNLLLNIGKGIESNIRDLIVPAVLLKSQSSSSKKDVCFTGRCKI